MVKSLLRSLLIPLAFVIGALFPAIGEYQWSIRYLLMVMLYLVVVRLDFSRLRPCTGHWLLLTAILGTSVAGWLLARASGCCVSVALALFFTFAAPTATAAPVVMRFLGGDVEFIVTAFALTNCGVGCAMVGLLPWVTGMFGIAAILEAGRSMLLVIGVPFAAGALTRRFFPRIRNGVPGSAYVSFLLWCLLLCINAGGAVGFLRAHPEVSGGSVWLVAVLALLVCALRFGCGGLLAGRRYRLEGSQAWGQANTSFCIFLALQFADPLAALGPTFYMVCHNLWNSFQLYRRAARRPQGE